MKKITALIIAAIFVILALCSCGEKATSEYISVDKAYYDKNSGSGLSNAEYNYSDGKSEVSSEIYESPKDESVTQKLIKKYSFNIESKKYDEAKAALETLVAKYGGYFSSSSESIRKNSYADTRYGTFLVRVPSQNVDSFAAETKEIGNVTSSTLNTEDVTESYYSLKAQLESLALQEERVLAMIEKATDLNTLIKLEDKLASIRSDITNLNYKIKYYDGAVDNSFVTVNLTEVIEYTEVVEEETFWTRLADAMSRTFVVFGNVLGEVLIAFVWMLPFALVGGIIAVVAIAANKRKRKIKAAKEAQQNEQ